MKQILLTILGTSIMNIFTFIIAQGFIKSYYGRQAREEISRWFDSTSKHMMKHKKEKK